MPRAKPAPKTRATDAKVSPKHKAVLDGLAASRKVAAVVDGFVNSTTGAGTSRSKLSAGQYVPNALLTEYELETLFADNDLAFTIVSKLVEDALRDGFSVEKDGGGEDSKQAGHEIIDALKELKADALLQRGGIMGRLFGGAGLIIGARGAGSLSSPLDDAKITKLEFLEDWDRQDVVPNTYYRDGRVESYLWTKPSLGGGLSPQVQVHESRLIVFPGAMTTSRKKIQNQGWDLSVLQRVIDTLKSFDSMFSSTDAMFADASQAVFKLQGLIASLSESVGTGEADVRTRLQMLDMFRSSGKAVMLDAGDENGSGGEEFSTVERTTLGSLDGVIMQYYVRLAAAARMPLTVLLGMSPAGMDATGEGDMILYYNSVDIYRKKVLEPHVLRMVRIVARILGEDNPEEWKICWPELSRPKPLDVATAEKMRVDAVSALITSQVVLPEEAALSLGKVAPTLGLTIDKSSREKALKEGLKELENREMTGPQALPEEPVGAAPAAKSSKRKTPSKSAGKQV